MLLAITLALGIVGAIVFGLFGVKGGEGGHLEQIYAIAFFFMALAGVVGLWARRSDRVHHIRVAPHHA